MGDNEEEIVTVRILSKRIKLRTVTGKLLEGHLDVYECEVPYIMVFLVSGDFGEVRMDVQKDDLSLELRLWLEGKLIRNPAAFVSARIDDAVNRFVKYGKTPSQEDLIMWLLSRSEFYLSQQTELVFGGKDFVAVEDTHHVASTSQFGNSYSKNVHAATMNKTTDEVDYRLQGELKEQEEMLHGGETQEQKAERLHRTAPSNNEDLGMFSMTRKLLGRSNTLSKVRQSASQLKGRDGAKTVVSANQWSGEQKRVCADIEYARKQIEKAMDTRRRIIEVARTRQTQSADKFRTIKDRLHQEQGGNKFMKEADHELRTLIKMEEDILDDLRRQRNRAHRSAQLVAWTMAPSGFVNRRGKWQKGPVLGEGPLHPNATSGLKDPRMELTMQHYYWDSAGRRHAKPAGGSEDEGNESLIEKAMEAIRKAAANVSAFKLDLKTIFEQFDTSGDGFLSPPEMAEAFISMGVKLDAESMIAIFKHFDPNDSGSVHFGEFVWAFFNRRSLVRQWKRKTTGMTAAQIKAKFHAADVNGDGKLVPKEFKRLLKSFGMEMRDDEIEILINRFDMDNDGDIDMNEFKAFIDSEQKALFSSTTDNSAGSTATANMLPPPKFAARGSTDKPSVPSRKSATTGARPTTTTTSSRQQQRQGGRLSRTARPASAGPRMPAGRAAGSQPLNRTAPQQQQQQQEEELYASSHNSAGITVSANARSKDKDKYNDSVGDNINMDNSYGSTAPQPVYEQSMRGVSTGGRPVGFDTTLLQKQAAIEARLGSQYYPRTSQY